MINFYASPYTNQKINSADKVAFLIGSFNGYGLNFGDGLQLKGVLEWYRQQFPDVLLCPFFHLQPTFGQSQFLIPHYEMFFDTKDWVFYTHHGEQPNFPEHYELEPLQIPKHEIILHVYGGGFFNGFWGKWMLDIIETVLRAFPVGHYIISGQQVGVEFAQLLAEHYHQYRPDLIGCRDPLSIHYLANYGVKAMFTSDDAFEEISQYAESAKSCIKQNLDRPIFGLHLNLSNYVRTLFASPDQVTPLNELSAQIEGMFLALKRHFGSHGMPLLVGGYLDPRIEVHDTWLTLKTQSIMWHSPNALVVDLPSLLLQNRLHEALPLLCSCDVFLGTSYHVSFFFKALRVPALLLTFNDYYRQKSSGIERSSRTVEDFLSANRTLLIGEQEEIIRAHYVARTEYLETLKHTLASSPKGVVARKVVFLSSRLEEQEQAIVRLEEEKRNLEGQVHLLQKQNAALADELFKSGERLEEQEQAIVRLEEEKRNLEGQVRLLQEQNAALADELFKSGARLEEQEQVIARLETTLKEIETARAWKAVRKYWDLASRPFYRTILWPARSLARIIWR